MTLLIEDRGPVRILTLNRPDKRNALDMELSRRLLEELRRADADEGVACVVLTGAGSAFSAGADISELKALRESGAAEARGQLTADLELAFTRIGKVIISAVNGPAMGAGAGLAVAADLALMAEGATLGYPEVRRGIVAALVLGNLVRQAGRKAAFELVASGEPVGARRALELGLVNRVVAPDQLLAEALRLGEKLAALDRAALSETKKLFHEVADLPLAQALEHGRQANLRMRNYDKLGGSGA